MDLFDKSVHVHPKARLYKALFVQNAFFNEMLLNGQKITFDMVCELFDVINNPEGEKAKKFLSVECKEEKFTQR